MWFMKWKWCKIIQWTRFFRENENHEFSFDKNLWNNYLNEVFFNFFPPWTAPSRPSKSRFCQLPSPEIVNCFELAVTHTFLTALFIDSCRGCCMTGKTLHIRLAKRPYLCGRGTFTAQQIFISPVWPTPEIFLPKKLKITTIWSNFLLAKLVTITNNRKKRLCLDVANLRID